jgi:alpha-L-rhamnosidase
MTSPFAANLIPQLLPAARWIWPNGELWDLHNGYALSRKSFTLDRTPKRAPAFITADQSYRLWVNGTPVCRGPARGFQSHWPCDEIDLAPYLRRGRNVLAVRAHNPGAGNFQYISQSAAGFLFSAKWGRAEIVSDQSWKTRRQSGVRKDTVTCSVQLFGQEHVDARLEPSDWMRPDFDDSEWKTDFYIAQVPGAMPWPRLEPRGIPQLEESLAPAPRLIGLGDGDSAPGYRETRDVFVHHHSQETGTYAAPSTKETARASVPPAGTGHFRSLLFDFGRVTVGCLNLRITGARGGEIIDTLHYETIDPATLRPHVELPSWSRIALGNRLICRPGENHHEFYHVVGSRYLAVLVRDSSKPLKIEVALNRVGYPLPIKGAFASSDPALEKIWQACAWTQQICSLDAYVDTPWREQAQWWGDARVQIWNTFHLNGDTSLLRRGLHCTAHQTTPEGVTYGHTPTIAHGCILPDFTLIWFLTLWDYYWQTGSIEPFVSHRETLTKALDYFERHTDAKTGLLRHDPRHWLFLDWTDLPKTGFPALYSLWYLYALQKIASLHRVAGEPAQAAVLERRASKLRTALRKLIRKDGLVCDGYDIAGKLHDSASIHTQTLALLTGLDPRNDTGRLERVLLPYVRGETEPSVRPSAYWVTYVLTELTQRGFGADVVAFIRSRWKAMADYGSTWETFTPVAGGESHSHAWSAHPLYHLMRTIGGLTQTAPAWKSIRFAPVFEGDHGASTIPSPAGKITSKWIRRKNGGVDVTLTLPPGVSAEVQLPGQPSTTIRSSRRWKVPAVG